jgi:hypothetical protein
MEVRDRQRGFARKNLGFGIMMTPCDNDVRMRLLTAHKILISAALFLSLLMTVRAGVIYASSHANSDVVFAVLGLLLSVCLGLYLRAIWGR